MPGPVSDSYKGTPEGKPYVPSWCYASDPKVCLCGHHEGYHDSAGRCVNAHQCSCAGLSADCLTPF